MIQSLPFPIFLVMLAFPLAMAGICIYAGIFARRRAALMKAMPTSEIATAEDGYREFEGLIEMIDRQAITTPLTLVPCCWYHARVEKWVPSRGKNSIARWDTVKDVTSTEPFFLRDASGICIVHPDGAEVTPTDKSLWYGANETPDDRNPRRVPPTESAKGMLEISGGPNSKYRFSEERIYAGDPLLVLGLFTSGREDASLEEGGDLDTEDFEPDSADLELEDGDAPLDEQLTERALSTTRAAVFKPGGKQPFILTTTPQAKHIQLSETGSIGVVFVALFPLAIAAYLVWARYGQ